MIPDIKRYLNKTIFVSIPVLFEHGTCMPYTLLGVELTGLWLQSDELTGRLLPDDRQDLASLAPVAFIPFAQIAGALFTTTAPAPPPPGEKSAGTYVTNPDRGPQAPRPHEESPPKRNTKKH